MSLLSQTLITTGIVAGAAVGANAQLSQTFQLNQPWSTTVQKGEGFFRVLEKCINFFDTTTALRVGKAIEQALKDAYGDEQLQEGLFTVTPRQDGDGPIYYEISFLVRTPRGFFQRVAMAYDIYTSPIVIVGQYQNDNVAPAQQQAQEAWNTIVAEALGAQKNQGVKKEKNEGGPAPLMSMPTELKAKFMDFQAYHRNYTRNENTPIPITQKTTSSGNIFSIDTSPLPTDGIIIFTYPTQILWKNTWYAIPAGYALPVKDIKGLIFRLNNNSLPDRATGLVFASKNFVIGN